MPATIRIPIEESSQPSEARRTARKMARDAGFDEIRAEQIAIVVTEAATNLLKHAHGGEILLRVTGSEEARGRPGIEILAIDHGPGMDNIERCMQDGYSTGVSPGQGLGAITRLSGESDFHSVPGKGTVILARWFSASPTGDMHDEAAPLQFGAVNVCKPGQEVCGDAWGAEQTAETSTLLVADGLGHGYEASLASHEAVRIFHENPDLSPAELVERCHQGLRGSRGAAVSVARINRTRGTLVFCGVGNVAAQIYGGSKISQHLVSVNGTAGHQIQRIREFNYPWPDNGMLLLYSDGLATGTGLDGQPSLALRDPSLIAGALYRDFSRGHDDATVVVAKAA
jgi:anti-sigma regulatory factor (Ser/Thr protein kinase)